MKNGKNKKRMGKREKNGETSPLGKMEKRKQTRNRQTIQSPTKDT